MKYIPPTPYELLQLVYQYCTAANLDPAVLANLATALAAVKDNYKRAFNQLELWDTREFELDAIAIAVEDAALLAEIEAARVALCATLTQEKADEIAGFNRQDVINEINASLLANSC